MHRMTSDAQGSAKKTAEYRARRMALFETRVILRCRFLYQRQIVHEHITRLADHQLAMIMMPTEG